MKSNKRIAITDGEKVRTVSEKNLDRFLKSSDGKGWRLFSNSQSPALNEKKPFEAAKPKEEADKKVETKPKEKAEKKAETKGENTGIPQEKRDAMIKTLKDKGINVHWNLSDEKLLKLYESETQES